MYVVNGSGVHSGSVLIDRPKTAASSQKHGNKSGEQYDSTMCKISTACECPRLCWWWCPSHHHAYVYTCGETRRANVFCTSHGVYAFHVLLISLHLRLLSYLVFIAFCCLAPPRLLFHLVMLSRAVSAELLETAHGSKLRIFSPSANSRVCVRKSINGAVTPV